jgi:hypothetical protein
MSFHSWLQNLRSTVAPRRGQRRGRNSLRAATHRPHLEVLEDRCLPSFSPATSSPSAPNPQAVVTADFNNDGRLDLATANQGNNSVSVLLGNGDGTFRNAVNFAAGFEPLSLAVGDFDGDGNLDLVTANRYDVSVLLGNGDGTFQPANTFYVYDFPTAVAVGDFNGDGLPDLGVTSNSDYDLYGHGGYGYISYVNVLLGDGAGGFSEPTLIDLSKGFYPSATVADFNGDGIDDFATASVGGGTVSVLLGDLSGSLQGPTDFYTGYYYSYGVAAADLDGDGDIDLVSANNDGSNVSVLLGDGNGGFGAAQNYAASADSAGVALADFNNDTHLDIITANYTYSGSVSVLLGRGDGTFSPPVNSAVGPNPWAVVAGDFNGDGWLDAATANYYGNNVSVLINDHSWPPADSVAVSINDVTVTEGNTGSTNATFTVTLSAASSQPVTVAYATANGTATPAATTRPTSGTLTFAPGETSKTITVLVIGDRLAEPNETFFVNLSGRPTRPSPTVRAWAPSWTTSRASASAT